MNTVLSQKGKDYSYARHDLITLSLLLTRFKKSATEQGEIIENGGISLV